MSSEDTGSLVNADNTPRTNKKEMFTSTVRISPLPVHVY